MDDKNFLKSVCRTAGMWLVHCIAGCGVLALLVYVVPHYMAVFANSEAELPAMTQLLISLAMAARHRESRGLHVFTLLKEGFSVISCHNCDGRSIMWLIPASIIEPKVARNASIRTTATK